ncbi:tyrosine--tRNA ligase [Candidatus Saccharibacteria bacterium]|nr:tyrosine--tRNA ligase [Candidatus Saccharibacteria bacterium]
MTMTLSEELTWRGFVNQTTYKDLTEIDKNRITFYFGVDPSADSMQIGNLAAALMVRHFIDRGHKAILLVGGATGMIGDPDGKKQERDLNTLEEIARNKKAIAEQYRTIFAGQDVEIVDNYDWFKSINYLEFLRDVGKHVPMRQMLGRDFVQSRLSEDGAGISYAEFSYSLIQGYDFLHLYRTKGVTLQVSGADQWGNSIAGVDLIRRIDGGEVHVWTTPLVINKSTGIKFGKTEGGAIWLDRNKTSIFKFYQFWLNLDDKGVIDYLKVFTLLPRDEIEDIARRFDEDKGSRLAQRILAYEVTKLVHGQEAADEQVRLAEVLFGGTKISLTRSEFEALASEFAVANVSGSIAETDVVAALVDVGLASSKSEARRFVQTGAVYINNQQLHLEDGEMFDLSDEYAIIRRGKNTTALLKRN